MQHTYSPVQVEHLWSHNATAAPRLCKCAVVQMSLSSLLPFLEGSLRLIVEQARNAAVVKSLRRSENLQIREDLTLCKQR